MKTTYKPQVLVDMHGRPFLVFDKGRIRYQAITARSTRIVKVSLTTLRDLRPAERAGEPYPPRRCASFWLNRDHRHVTKGARRILRGLVARKREAA